MEKPTSLEDLCSTVCQHLTAYVKFAEVDDRICSVLLMRAQLSVTLAIPDAEKTTAVKQITFSYFHLQVFPP